MADGQLHSHTQGVAQLGLAGPAGQQEGHMDNISRCPKCRKFVLSFMVAITK
jgi:hypothetical protein